MARPIQACLSSSKLSECWCLLVHVHSLGVKPRKNVLHGTYHVSASLVLSNIVEFLFSSNIVKSDLVRSIQACLASCKLSVSLSMVFSASISRALSPRLPGTTSGLRYCLTVSTKHKNEAYGLMYCLNVTIMHETPWTQVSAMHEMKHLASCIAWMSLSCMKHVDSGLHNARKQHLASERECLNNNIVHGTLLGPQTRLCHQLPFTCTSVFPPSDTLITHYSRIFISSSTYFRYQIT